jgi:ADP-heptose:LPS heptosyltransferase
MIGLPIRQAAAVIERAEALITVESGMWYVAAALHTPLLIVPWWLPRSVDWVAPMGVPYSLLPRSEASVEVVLSRLDLLLEHERGAPVDAGA